MATARKTKMPKWQPAPETLVRRFEKVVQAVPDVQPRKMFGYPAAFINGQMFTGLFQESMILRLPADDRDDLMKHSGAKPFEPMPGRPMAEYVAVPPSLLAHPPSLERWVHAALEYGASLSPKAPRAKPKPSAEPKPRAKPAAGKPKSR